MLQTMRLFIRKYWPVLLLAVIINLIVLVNAIIHHPKIGYDVTEHLTYIQILPYRLPGPKDTNEYFSAPLAYILPSLFDKTVAAGQGLIRERAWDGKFAQMLNFLISIGITVLLWKTAELLRPGSRWFKASILAMLGLLTVYYKTFSQVRGEPYVAFFVCLAFYQVLHLLKNQNRLNGKDGIRLGVTLGLLILSRQWGFFIFPALAVVFGLIFWKNRAAGWKPIQVLAISTAVAFLIGGWFYLHLLFSFGTVTAFNRQSSGFSFSNQPRTFYLSTGLRHLALFRNPVRPAFNNLLMPIFYSDTWGDYWGYFVSISTDMPQIELTANKEEIAPYLGRVNLVSLFPSMILLGGVVLGSLNLVKSIRLGGIKRGEDSKMTEAHESDRCLDAETLFLTFLFSFIVFSWLGYLWFLISYPIPESGVTNKATYMIQIFMALPILAAVLLEKLRAARPMLHRAIMIGLALVFLHNLPAMITRFYWRTY